MLPGGLRSLSASLRSRFSSMSAAAAPAAPAVCAAGVTTPLREAVVAVVCPPDASPDLLDAMRPLPPRCEVILANDAETFFDDPRFPRVNALMFVAAGGDVSLLPKLFDAVPAGGIQWVHSLFAGVDALAPFCQSHLLAPGLLANNHHGIPLTNGRGAFSESLGEYVIAACLHFNKQVPRCQVNRASKIWDKFVMPTLKGKTIGFLGFGHIGQTTARLAKAFGLRVLALRRNPDKDDEGRALADEVLGSGSAEAKRRIFSESDFVVSVLPGTPDTLDFCGADEFAAMKPTGVFISVGRGLVVDEEALADALEAGTIAGAALDVFKQEPLPASSRLWGCGDRLLMTAHNADFTSDYFKLGWNIWKANLASFQRMEEFVTLVDKERGY